MSKFIPIISYGEFYAPNVSTVYRARVRVSKEQATAFLDMWNKRREGFKKLPSFDYDDMKRDCGFAVSDNCYFLTITQYTDLVLFLEAGLNVAEKLEYRAVRRLRSLLNQRKNVIMVVDKQHCNTISQKSGNK